MVNLFRSLGMNAERTLESGARSDGSPTHDINLQTDALYKGECKVRSSGFKQIYDWLGDNEFLTIRADRRERLYVVPERVFLQLMKDRG